ncbi:hypothetical protein QJQ45_004433 [Haematococcus lacustris]|nr:hypothetical protein QJQ45_004433 [Haematococcus lacustris]
MQSDPDAAMCSALVSLVQSLPLVVHPLMMYTQQEDPATVSALNAAVNCGQQLRALQTVLCCTQLQMHEVERRLACQCPPPPNPPPLTAMLDPSQQPPVAQQLPTPASLNTSPSIRLGQLPSAPCQRQGHCPMPILPVASISNSQTAQQTVNSVMSVMPLQLPPPEQAATHGQAGGYPCPWPASADRPGANGSSFVHTDLTHQGPAPPSAAAPAAPSPCRSSLQPPSPFGAAPSPTGSPPGGLLPAACPTPPSRHSLRCSSQQRSSLGQQGGVGRGVANSLDQDSQGGAGRDSQSVTPSQRERILEQLLFLTGRESDSGSSRGSSQELEEDEQEGEEGEAAGAEDGDHSSARCSSGGMTAGPTGGTPGGCMEARPAVRPSKPGPCQAQQAGREAQGPWQQSRCTSTGAGYSAQLTAGGWAHRLAMPELGCLLVARDTGPADAATAGQPGRQDSAFFHRAVVLITSHDPVRGSVGLVLNKASPLRVRDLTVTAAVQGFMSVFSEHTLQLGGPVHLDHVTLLHRFRGLQGAACVADGLYTGGLPAAVQLVQAGLALPSDFVLALGVSGWRPVQLQRELMAGCWDIVAAAPDLVLPPGPLTASGPAGTGGSSGTGSGSRAGAAAGADWLQHAGEAPQRLPPALAAAALAEQRGGTAPGRQRKGQGRRLDTSTPALRPPPQPRPASGTPASAPPYCLWSHIRGVAQLQ